MATVTETAATSTVGRQEADTWANIGRALAGISFMTEQRQRTGRSSAAFGARQAATGLQLANDRRWRTAAAFVRRHRFGSYALGAFAISWTGVLIVAWSAGFAFGTPQASIPVLLAMLTGPPISAIAVTAVADGRPGLRHLWQSLRRWRVGARWYAFLLVMPVLVVAILTIFGWFVDDGYAPEFNLAFILIGLAAGTFEELGWTGVATPDLLRRRRPLMAALILGVVWSSWHVLADAITYDGGYWLPSLWFPKFATVFIVGLIAWRVVMTYIYARTESLLLGVLLHGLYTGSIGAFQPVGSEGAYVTWTAVMAAVLCVIAGLMVRSHKTWRVVE